jgi:transposase InsO family protein
MWSVDVLMLCGRSLRRLNTHRRAAGRVSAPLADHDRPGPGCCGRPDLVDRDFTVDASAVDTRWCGDISYITTWEGWLYPATVIDLASRRVVGWAVADHLGTDLVDAALSDARQRRRLIH